MNDSPSPEGVREQKPPTDDALETVPGATKPRRSSRWDIRRILPWIIAAAAVVVAAVAIGVLVVDESGEPEPVARLTPQTGAAADAPVPVLEDEVARAANLTEPDFVSYGSYGELGIWSTTNSDGWQCIVIDVEGSAVMVRCTAPTLATVADVSFPSDMFPPAASGEPIPELSTVRFVLHEDAVDVLVGPWPEDES